MSYIPDHNSKERQYMYHYVYDHEWAPDEHVSDPDDFIRRFKAVVDKHRHQKDLVLCKEYTEGADRYMLRYLALETDAEYESRMTHLQRVVDYEREQYERLKKKFEK